MKVFIVGATGRMGEEIRGQIAANKKVKFAGGIAEKSSLRDNIVNDFSKVKGKVDVVIDFSHAALFPEVVRWCVSQGFPLLSGTTGISTADKKLVNQAGKKIPILWAPNTAPGVHWVKKIFLALNPPPDFDIQITETHHTRKKDKPSGTALLLQEAVETKQKTVSPPISIRTGEVFGIHTIELRAKDEVITITHEALSRTLFARGALGAALWLAKQKAGVYGMDDYI